MPITLRACCLVWPSGSCCAQAAARVVKVDAVPLPGVYDVEQALVTGAPSIHPGGNQIEEFRVERGDVERAMRQADVVVENRYVAPPPPKGLRSSTHWRPR